MKASRFTVYKIALCALLALTFCAGCAPEVVNPLEEENPVMAENSPTAEAAATATPIPTFSFSHPPTATPAPGAQASEGAEGASASPGASVSPGASAGASASAPAVSAAGYVLAPKEGDLLALLEIPSVNLSEKVIYGMTNAILKKNVGCYTGTLLPGEGGGILFSAHRDQHFRPLENLKDGAEIIVTTAKGKFVYKVEKMQVVEKDDQQAFKMYTKETLLLSTCYPFRYVGAAPNRYLVFAPLQSFTPAS